MNNVQCKVRIFYLGRLSRSVVSTSWLVLVKRGGLEFEIALGDRVRLLLLLSVLLSRLGLLILICEANFGLGRFGL